MMAQDGGFPVPVGGAGQLTAALASRAPVGRCAHRVWREVDADRRQRRARGRGPHRRRIDRAGPARGDRRHLGAAAVSAAAPRGRGAAAVHRGMAQFVWDTPVLKINYALDGPIPWRSQNLNEAGTVHLGADRDGLIRWMADLNTATVPEQPFMLFGQMTTADAGRSPAGTESAWAYTHLPRGMADDESADRLVGRSRPGAREACAGLRRARSSARRSSGRRTSRPVDANLHTGAVNGGTSQLFQQLIFRPAPGFGGAETPVRERLSRQRRRHAGRRCARRVRPQRRASRVGIRRGAGLAAAPAHRRGELTVPALRSGHLPRRGLSGSRPQRAFPSAFSTTGVSTSSAKRRSCASSPTAGSAGGAPR